MNWRGLKKNARAPREFNSKPPQFQKAICTHAHTYICIGAKGGATIGTG